MLSQNTEARLRAGPLARMDAAPKNVGEHGVTQEEENDAKKILGQTLVICDIIYKDSANTIRHIIGAAYQNTRKTLPSRLLKLLPPPPPSYKICNIAGKGKGVVALRNIDMGEIIMIERPILVYPTVLNIGRDQLTEGIMRRLREEPDDYNRLFSLLNVKGKDIPEFWGILGTNSMAVDLNKHGERYGGVFPEISRINHRCVAFIILRNFC
ncbi:hypothetical protein M422DRAFT_259943 [Sphaerobolus stellatus SS14]|uniref:SET domain-containing protein n=1 Tax=Sphaerobolus stellatus (strain SS14) TaxID=990650 RepID=A0A0C9VJL2_SPHS4|nr:hypothetical protein M422DRAFT_259943 [Sphaerobolus stellatus SS14]